MGFVSIVVPAFFGILDSRKVKVLPWLIGITIFWTCYGVILLTGGIIPLGPGDFISPADRQVWMSSAFFTEGSRVWLTGTAIGTGLIGISLAREKMATWFH